MAGADPRVGGPIMGLAVLGLAMVLGSCSSTPPPGSVAAALAGDSAPLSGFPAPAGEARNLRVVTWNLGLLRVLGRNFVPLVAEREAAMAWGVGTFVEAESPDLLVFQEVWSARQARILSEALEARGYETWVPPGRSVIGLGAGLLLAVRAPLSMGSLDAGERGFEAHRHQAGISKFARRGNAWVVVRDEAGKPLLVLVGTHLMAADTVAGVPVDRAQADAMGGQRSQLLGLLDRLRLATGLPLVLAGDFNAGPGYVDEVWQGLLAAEEGSLGLTDTWGLVGSGGGELPSGDGPTWDQSNPLVARGDYPEEPTARIDHVLVARGAVSRWRGKGLRVEPGPALTVPTKSRVLGGEVIPLSDHYALVVDLVLEAAL